MYVVVYGILNTDIHQIGVVMLKNKRALILLALIPLAFSNIQADWHDTLRWLQNNAKRQNVTTRVAAVVGVAALCAVGIGCWWKLRQPAKSDEVIRYAFHRRLLCKGEYAEYQLSEDKSQGYKLFSLYYTDHDKQALDHLLNQNITKTQNILDEFFNYSQNVSAGKGNYFKELFKNMSVIVREYDPKAKIAAGVVFVDVKNNTLYAANIGNIVISNNRMDGYYQGATDKYLGQKLKTSDVQVNALTMPARLDGELVIAGVPCQKKTSAWLSQIDFTTQGSDDDMIDIVKDKDVALAVKWW